MKTPPANPHPTPTDHFTNFTEIATEKRASATTSVKCLPLLTSVPPAEVEGPTPCQSGAMPDG